MAQDRLLEKFSRRIELCHFILERLYELAASAEDTVTMPDRALVQFSLVGLHKAYCDQIRLRDSQAETTLDTWRTPCCTSPKSAPCGWRAASWCSTTAWKSSS